MASLDDFNKSFEYLLKWEGGFSAHPQDRGNWTSGVVGKGELRGTKYGIASHVYPQLDIRHLTKKQAKDIYYRDYWVKAGCPVMPARLANVMFDAAVNNGVGRAVRWLQEVVGSEVDGRFGPRTEKAMVEMLVASASGDLSLASLVHSKRDKFMRGLKDWATFGRGWERRLGGVLLQTTEGWPVA